MFSISLRSYGCSTTVALNGITVIEPDSRISRSLSVGCAGSIIRGRNKLALAVSVNEKVGELRGSSSVEVELDRCRRTTSGIESTPMVRIHRKLGDEDTVVIHEEFSVPDAPDLELWSSDPVERFTRSDADRAYELARRIAQALERGDHAAAVEDARIKFQDISRSLEVGVEQTVEIYMQSLQEVGKITTVPFTLADLRVVVEADSRLFMLKRKGGIPLVSFLAGEKRFHAPVGLSRIGGTWVISR